MKQIKVLIIEDSIYSADLNIRELKRAGFIVQHKIVACSKAVQKALESEEWDIIISDHNMQGFDALQALELRNQLCSLTPFVIVSEDMMDKHLDKAFEAGCCDYIDKGHLEKLGQCVRKINEAQENLKLQR